MPMALTFSASSFNPPGSFSSLTTQSPREQLSLLRLPNQPSSSTNSSAPISAPFRAMARSLSVLKLKYVPSQLFTSTGRSRSRQRPRHTRVRISLWKMADMPLRPAPE